MTAGAVSGLVQKALRNKNFLSELISERDLRQQNRQRIAEAITEMSAREDFIDSVAHVQKELEKAAGPQAKSHVLRHIMRHDLKMRYKKIIPLALTANSHRNLILRQQFGLAFLEIDLEKKVVISVDESWLGMSDFRRRKWCDPGKINSVAQLQILPRISMITALTNRGEIYLSLVQANSNTALMMLYFR